jgi:hypothetical protein
MKNYKTLFLAGSLFFVFSCKKVNENISTTETNADLLKKTMRLNASQCDPPQTIDVNSFALENQVPDQPIDPATSGTEIQNAQNNYEKIQWCLITYGRARLNTGVFPVSHYLTVNNADLTSANGDWSTIKAVAPTSALDNSLVKMYGHSRVSFLTLNANKHFLKKCNSSVVEVTGLGNKVDNNFIKGGDVTLYKTDTGTIAGVYIMCGDSNEVWNNKISNNHSGVIVNSTNYHEAKENVVKGNDLFLNRSDGITLVTYGQVLNNKIYKNGWDCQNGWKGCTIGYDFEGYPAGVPPIPGAGIYSEDNHVGALIDGNTIYDNNGHNIDVTNVQKFVIRNNTVYNPGNMNFPETDYGIAPDYGGAFSVSLFDVSDCVIEDNDIRNEGRPTNAVDYGYWANDGNNIFNVTVESGPNKTFGDLPFHGSSVIGFCLAELRPGSVKNQVSGNIIKHNIFIASPNGIGYFASRNTGFDEAYNWSQFTTNYYTLNDPNGSNVGSVRCGGNWYAGNGGAEVNTDDAQHAPPVGSWPGNDVNKQFYQPQ